VGCVNIDGSLWQRSKTADFVTIHAQCHNINLPDGAGGWRIPAEVEGVSYGEIALCPQLLMFAKTTQYAHQALTA
jgi:hypothetical protein